MCCVRACCELPVLLAVTGLAWWLVADGELSILDGVGQMGLFALLAGWSAWRDDALATALAGAIRPHEVDPALLSRDLPVLMVVTAAQ